MGRKYFVLFLLFCSPFLSRSQSAFASEAFQKTLQEVVAFRKIDSLNVFSESKLIRLTSVDFFDIATNFSRLEKIDSRINSIDKNNLLLSSYNAFIEDAISTQCVTIQRRLFNNFLNKWREILLDYEALEALSDLKEVDEKAKSINEIISDLKRAISLIANTTGILKFTQVDDASPDEVRRCFQKFKDISQSFNNIDLLINKYKSTKNKIVW